MDSKHQVLFYATLKGISTETPKLEPTACKSGNGQQYQLAKEIWDQLHAFKADDTKEELVFPQSLSNKERNLIHQAAEGLGLSHVSKGEGSERHVVVTKKKKHGEGEKEKGKEEGKEKNAKSAKKPYAVCSPPFKGEDGRMVIQFYRERDLPFGCFSNFSRHPILIDGKKWRTTEHYFQAMKFDGVNKDHFKVVKKTKDPMTAKNMARSFPGRVSNWEEIKDAVMYKCVLAKFQQHVDIQKILLDTEDAVLVEHTSNDSYWADGGDGSGKNMLGVTLMRVRDTLRNH